MNELRIINTIFKSGTFECAESPSDNIHFRIRRGGDHHYIGPLYIDLQPLPIKVYKLEIIIESGNRTVMFFSEDLYTILVEFYKHLLRTDNFRAASILETICHNNEYKFVGINPDGDLAIIDKMTECEVKYIIKLKFNPKLSVGTLGFDLFIEWLTRHRHKYINLEE